MLRGRANVTTSQGDGSEYAQRARGQRVGSQRVGGGEAGRCGGCVETPGGELDLGAQDCGSGRLQPPAGYQLSPPSRWQVPRTDSAPASRGPNGPDARLDGFEELRCVVEIM